MQKEDRIKALIIKHLKEELTDAERLELQTWVAAADSNRLLFEELTRTDSLRASLKEYYASATWLNKDTPQGNSTKVVPLQSRSRSLRTWFIAASIIVLISTCAYLIFFTRGESKPSVSMNNKPADKAGEVLPASRKATLTLADNTTISLQDAQQGTIAEQAGTTVKKADDGSLWYDAAGKKATGPAISFNTMTTPRGGYYIVTLPDGSKVWLNASSSLKFPTAFTNDSRAVELQGEAYFEIAKVISPVTKKRVPFIVNAGKGAIQVLGTKFNVNNYTEEKSMVTTLLEGSVQVTASGISRPEKLVPGQQALLSNGSTGLSVQKADAEAVISWTRGEFYFDNADLPGVMRQLSRWYDITVVYDDPAIASLPRTFRGAIQRNLPLSQVLPQLERIGNVKLTVAGTTVHVNKGQP